MAQTNVCIRMDGNLKNEFDNICRELGLTTSAAFTVFARAVVRCGGIPFEMVIDQPNAKTIAAIEEARAAEKNKSPGKGYTDAGEMMKELLS